MTQVLSYITESKDELKNVQWPTRNQGIRLTVYVIGASLLVGLFIATTDKLLEGLLAAILGL